MPYLLDGNNLIGIVRRSARPSEEDRSALIAEIAARLRVTRARATIFFDGPAGERTASLGNLTVRVPSSGTADDAILRELGRAGKPREAIVVTADRELGRRARDAGAKVCPPQEFFERFGTVRGGSEARADAASVDVEEWTKYFQDEGNRK